ncbi:reverse transcriptase domain-containing protein, partial [Acinetobacter baumannii]|uniref:reverse transcriptase domain-containing protein n=1 Tax=Acinetobacter baumannii TaxID=470 RepID=UPI00117765AE
MFCFFYCEQFIYISLLFADDVILLSETPEGLQTLLDQLHDYSYKWSLSVNLEKTENMIFNKRGILIKENSFN